MTTASDLATLVSAALADLAARAGCRPDDASPAAVGLVLGVLRADGATGERGNPGACAVRQWVRQRTGVPFRDEDGQWSERPGLLVGAGGALVTGWHVPGEFRGRVRVALPPCVAAAVAQMDAYSQAGRTPELYTEAA